MDYGIVLTVVEADGAVKMWPFGPFDGQEAENFFPVMAEMCELVTEKKFALDIVDLVSGDIVEMHWTAGMDSPFPQEMIVNTAKGLLKPVEEGEEEEGEVDDE
jgi:hypothetical protein